MARGNWGRWVLIAGVTLGALWYLIPTYYSFFVLPKSQRNDLKLLQSKLPSWAPSASHRLNLGLDLQGGIHMVMRVDTQTALQKRVERRGLQIVNYLKDQKIDGVTYTTEPEKLELTLKAPDAASLDEGGEGAEGLRRLHPGGPRRRTASPTSSRTRRSRASATRRSTRRCSSSAAASTSGAWPRWTCGRWARTRSRFRFPDSRIPSRPRSSSAPPPSSSSAWSTTRTRSSASWWPSTRPRRTPEFAWSGPTATTSSRARTARALLAYARQGVPADREVLLQCVSAQAQKGLCDSYLAYLVDKAVPLTGESLATADYNRSQTSNDFEVNLSFDTQGGVEFGKLTGDNVGRYMAIVLDENVNSAPRINERIPNGRARITLGHAIGKTDEQMLQEALNLVLVLRAGALPAPVSVGRDPSGRREPRGRAHSQGQPRRPGGPGAGGGLHGGLLPEVGAHRRRGADPQRRPDPRRPGAVQRHAHPAGHRRLRAHPGHRGGRQRPDQRAGA